MQKRARRAMLLHASTTGRQAPPPLRHRRRTLPKRRASSGGWRSTKEPDGHLPAEQPIRQPGRASLSDSGARNGSFFTGLLTTLVIGLHPLTRSTLMTIEQDNKAIVDRWFTSFWG